MLYTDGSGSATQPSSIKHMTEKTKKKLRKKLPQRDGSDVNSESQQLSTADSRQDDAKKRTDSVSVSVSGFIFLSASSVCRANRSYLFLLTQITYFT